MFPGIGWLLSKAEQLVRWVGRQPEARRYREAVRAWTHVEFSQLCGFLSDYYRGEGVPLFSYRSTGGSSFRVPLFVRDEWLDLQDDSLVMTRSPDERSFEPTSIQRRFLETYLAVRPALGLTNLLWNGRIFQLVEMRSLMGKLHLRFEQGRFFDSVMSQYVLEHELRIALSRGHSGGTTLPIRRELASDMKSIETFGAKQVMRIGVSNLLLLRQSRSMYRPVIRQRGALSMGHVGDFDAVSSGVFDIATANPAVDFDLKYKVLKEIFEELLGGAEVEQEIRELDPEFFYERPGILEIRQMLKDGRASFSVSGFCIDLVRLVPEITTVLVVRDHAYYKQYRSRFRVNLEYGPAFNSEIPRDITDADDYLVHHFPSNPASPEGGTGFDPMRWTLPGGFCFCQGVKRSVANRLL